MKIAFIVGGFPKFSETFILYQITGLIDLGHDVRILSRRRLNERTVHSEVHKYKLLEKVEYYDLPQMRVRRMVRSLVTFFRFIPRYPLAIFHCLNFIKFKSFYAILNNLLHIPPFLKDNYDVVMCHFGTNGVDFCFLKTIFPNLRFITMFHGTDLSLGDEQGHGVFTLLRNYGDLFLVTTNCYGRKKLRELGFDESKIKTHRLGVRVRDITFKERRREGNQLRILSVARLVSVKGLEFGIRAVANLRQKIKVPKIQYEIIGDGELRDSLLNLIADLDCMEDIRLLGAQSSVEVLRKMHGSHIFLFPSLMEGAGVVLLEAQATGLPIVASRVGGVPETTRDGRSAILIPPGDVCSITDALKYLIGHPESWPQMGQEGRQFVEEEHEFTRLNKELEGYLSSTHH